jgi:hypothetical protein
MNRVRDKEEIGEVLNISLSPEELEIAPERQRGRKSGAD